MSTGWVRALGRATAATAAAAADGRTPRGLRVHWPKQRTSKRFCSWSGSQQLASITCHTQLQPRPALAARATARQRRSGSPVAWRNGSECSGSRIRGASHGVRAKIDCSAAKVIAPPYDVISAEQRAELEAQHARKTGRETGT